MDKYGICHICLQNKKLTFEHFPPKKPFNCFKVNVNGKTIQKGFGDYTLCEKCNNNTGAWFAKDFEKFSKAVHQLQMDRKDIFATNEERIVCFSVDKINLLAVAKQFLTIICSVLDMETLNKYHFEKILMEKETKITSDMNEDFNLMVGINDDFDSGIISSSPFYADGGRKVFCVNIYPFKIVFIDSKSERLPGYVCFENYLKADYREYDTYQFTMSYLKDDLLTIV